MYVCMHVCTYVCMYACMYTRMYACMCFVAQQPEGHGKARSGRAPEVDKTGALAIPSSPPAFWPAPSAWPSGPAGRTVSVMPRIFQCSMAELCSQAKHAGGAIATLGRQCVGQQRRELRVDRRLLVWEARQEGVGRWVSAKRKAPEAAPAPRARSRVQRILCEGRHARVQHGCMRDSREHRRAVASGRILLVLGDRCTRRGLGTRRRVGLESVKALPLFAAVGGRRSHIPLPPAPLNPLRT